MSNPKQEQHPLFSKSNLLWMGIGLIVLCIGFIMMGGGKNQDPNVFDYSLTYSFRRITLAPILILLGFGIEVYAILRNPNCSPKEK